MIDTNATRNQAASSLDVTDAGSWGPAKAIIYLGLAGLLLSVVALINHFPVIFFDTSNYIDRASAVMKLLLGSSTAAQEIGVAMSGAGKATTGETYSNPFFLRPFTYSAFLIPFATPLTFLLTPFAHGVLSAYVIRRLLVAVGVASTAAFAACILLLTGFSSLPVTAAYVMPDIFTGLLIAFSFAVVQGWERRSVSGRLFDTGLMTFLVAAHLSHIPIALAISVMFLLSLAVFRGAFRAPYILGGVVVPLIVAPMILIASNVAVAGRPVISESSSLFLLARFVGDGITQQYLRTACPQKDYVLCSELGRLDEADTHGSVSDYFLWDKDGTVSRLSNPRLVDEAPELNRETLRAYPGQITRNAIGNTINQLLTFQIDDDINNPPAPFVTQSIAGVSPALADQYLNSLQSRGVFPLEIARGLANAGLIASLAVIGYIAAFQRQLIDRRLWLLGLFALAGIAENALAIGALSEVHNRYQSRVMWLVPLVAIIFAASVISKLRQGSAASTAPAHVLS